MNRKIFVALVITLFCVAGSVFAQTTDASLKPVYKSGDVELIAADKIVIKTNTGSLNIVLNDKTEFKRISAEKPSLSTAATVTLTEIAAGDKVTVSCLATADGKSLWGRTVYLMTQSEINQKKAKEAAEWRTRGIAGKVATVNAQTNQIVVEMSSMIGATKLTLTPKSDAKFMRYSSDSIKYADAKVSTIAEIKTGDQIRALGDKSTDGTAFTAETVLTGSFRQSAGKVISIDIAKNEAVVEDIATKKNVTVAFGEAILLKRFPPEMAERMAGFQMPGAARPPGQQGQGQVVVQQGPPSGTQPPANGQPQSGGPGRMMGGPRGGGMDDMLERLPNITAADLKVGDMIAILTSGSQVTADKVKAIKLIAGVEPFIKMAQAAAAMSGRGQGGGNQPGLNIPGLDGIGIP
jgi:ribosomal protein L24